MSTLYIEEYAIIGTIPTNAQTLGPVQVQAASQPRLAAQNISFTGTAGTSAAFNSATRLVRIHTDGICSYRFSAAGTAAATTDSRMAADTTEYWVVPGGYFVSAITNT